MWPLNNWSSACASRWRPLSISRQATRSGFLRILFLSELGLFPCLITSQIDTAPKHRDRQELGRRVGLEPPHLLVEPPQLLSPGEPKATLRLTVELHGLGEGVEVEGTS